MKLVRKGVHKSIESNMVRSGDSYNSVNSLEDDSTHSSQALTALEIERSGDDRLHPKSIEAKSMNQASWMSCYISLGSTILGAGILGVPYAISLMGWIPGMIFLFMSAALSFFGLHLMAECALQGPAVSSFYGMAQLTVPNLAVWIDVLITLKGVGTVTSYLLVIADSIILAFQFSGISFLRSRFWVLVMSFVFILPLSYFPSLDSLRYTSAISVIMILLLALMIFLYSLDLKGTIFDPCPLATSCPNTSHIAFTNHPAHFLRAFPILLFGFSCQQNAFTIVNELREPTRWRLNSIFLAAVGSSWAVNMVVGTCAYITFGSGALSDILKTYPENALTSFCRVTMAAVVACHYPLQLHPSRRTALSLWQRAFPAQQVDSTSDSSGGIGGIDATTFRRRFNIYTTIFNLTTFTIAVLVEDLGTVLSVLGATMSTLVILLLPGIFYYKLASSSTVLTSASSTRRPPDSPSTSNLSKSTSMSTSISLSRSSSKKTTTSTGNGNNHNSASSTSPLHRVAYTMIASTSPHHANNLNITSVRHLEEGFDEHSNKGSVPNRSAFEGVEIDQQIGTLDVSISNVNPSANINDHESSPGRDNSSLPGVRWKRPAALGMLVLGCCVLVLSLVAIFFFSN